MRLRIVNRAPLCLVPRSVPCSVLTLSLCCYWQARCRGFLVRREFNRRNWATTTIQAYARGMIARRRYKKMKVSSPGRGGTGRDGMGRPDGMTTVCLSVCVTAEWSDPGSASAGCTYSDVALFTSDLPAVVCDPLYVCACPPDQSGTHSPSPGPSPTRYTLKYVVVVTTSTNPTTPTQPRDRSALSGDGRGDCGCWARDQSATHVRRACTPTLTILRRRVTSRFSPNAAGWDGVGASCRPDTLHCTGAQVPGRVGLTGAGAVVTAKRTNLELCKLAPVDRWR